MFAVRLHAFSVHLGCVFRDNCFHSFQFISFNKLGLHALERAFMCVCGAFACIYLHFCNHFNCILLLNCVYIHLRVFMCVCRANTHAISVRLRARAELDIFFH